MRNILVVCRTNAVMSPVVAALLKARAKGSWRVWSAGSEPALRTNPYTFAVLKEAGIPLEPEHRPVDWHSFAGAGAPRLEVVLTVSEDVAWEAMPRWNGVPRLVHWAFPDPLAVTSTASERLGLIRAWRDLAEAKVNAFLLEENVQARARVSANDNRGPILERGADLGRPRIVGL